MAMVSSQSRCSFHCKCLGLMDSGEWSFRQGLQCSRILARKSPWVRLEAVPEQATGASVSTSKSSRIYVGNLPWNCDSEELARVLQRVGIVEHVQEVEVICNRETGRSRRFGYVTLTTTEMAQVAVQKLDGLTLEGNALKASFSQPLKRTGTRTQVKQDNPSTHTKLFIGNLPWGVDDGSLEEFFRLHGRVIEAKIVYNRDTGRSRGFGFVTLSSAKEADEAIKCLNGAECDGRQLRVTLAVLPAPEASPYVQQEEQ